MFVTPAAWWMPLQPRSTVPTATCSSTCVREGLDERVLQRPQRAAEHDDGHPRDRRLELEGGLEAVREDDHVLELGARDEGAGRGERRRADVDDHRVAVVDQVGGGAADRELLGREARQRLLERALPAEIETRHRPAPDPGDLSLLGENRQVVPGGHLRDAELARELVDPDEGPLVDQREHAVTALVGAYRAARSSPSAAGARGSACSPAPRSLIVSGFFLCS